MNESVCFSDVSVMYFLARIHCFQLYEYKKFFSLYVEFKVSDLYT